MIVGLTIASLPARAEGGEGEEDGEEEEVLSFFDADADAADADAADADADAAVAAVIFAAASAVAHFTLFFLLRRPFPSPLPPFGVLAFLRAPVLDKKEKKGGQEACVSRLGKEKDEIKKG